MTEKRTEMLVIRLTPSEMKHMKNAAKALFTPVSTLARQELMTKFGMFTEDGMLELEDGTRVPLKTFGFRPGKPTEIKLSETGAEINEAVLVNMMREEFREMKERLEEMELVLATFSE